MLCEIETRRQNDGRLDRRMDSVLRGYIVLASRAHLFFRVVAVLF